MITRTVGRLGILTEFAPESLSIVTRQRGTNLQPLIPETIALDHAYAVCGPMFSIVEGSGYRQSSGYELIRPAYDLWTKTDRKVQRRAKALSYSPLGTLKVVNPQERQFAETFRCEMYPWIISNLQNETSRSIDADEVRRAMLGVTSRGRAGVYAWTGSMYDGCSEAIGLGMIDAGYLDGGGSFVEYVNGQRIHGARPEFQRPIASLIVSRKIAISPMGAVAAAVAIATGFILTRSM